MRLRDGATIRYEVRGQGPPVTFVAGLGDDHGLCESLVDALQTTHRCLSFDNRGAGHSSPPRHPASVAGFADDAHELAGALGHLPGMAVGCSMGGAIVQEWALRHPDDLRAVVLISTWARTDVALADRLHGWSRLAEGGALDALSADMLHRCVSAEYLRDHPMQAASMRATDPPEPVGFQAQARACLGHDARERLSDLRIPVLVIVGDGDQVVDPAHGRQIADVIPGARLGSLPTGHVPFWERPDETLRLICDFVSEV